MSNISMEKIRLILLLLGKGVSQSSISKITHSSKRTVSQCRKAAIESNHSYEELRAMTDSELAAALNITPKEAESADNRKAELDKLMPETLQHLNRPHANFLMVFNEFYLKKCPKGFRYTQFKKYVKEHIKNTNYSFHNEYVPGRDWQIDFAGDPLYITDRLTRERTKLSVLVCVMPYSNLIFMIALPKATTEWFFYGLNKGLQYMGALPAVAHTDNMRQWVNKSERYSLTFSDGTRDWAIYYGIEPTACRVRKPRDKGPVEGAVNQLYQYVYARIEGEEYNTLESLNNRIFELLDEYNSLPFKGRSRREIFLEEEKPEMNPLPLTMYSFKLCKFIKLGSNYHFTLGPERHFFSAPCKYVGQKIKILWDEMTVQVYSGLDLICEHVRDMKPYAYTTVKDHMPPKHQAYIKQREGQNAASFIERGKKIGPNTGSLIEKVLASNVFPQQAYNRCHGILSLARTYGETRVENASRILLESNLPISYQALKDMLKNNRDLDHGDIISNTPFNEDVRGPQAFMLDDEAKDGPSDSERKSDQDNKDNEKEDNDGVDGNKRS